jgi:hypothetical protein
MLFKLKLARKMLIYKETRRKGMNTFKEILEAFISEVKELKRHYEIYFFMRKYTIASNRKIRGSGIHEKN